jgi:L-rhamnose mutarotase
MIRHCFALDLKDDPALIAEYENYHQAIWPEIEQSIMESGIQNMSIYRTGNRLFMIMEVEDNFSFEKKAGQDSSNPKVQEWEQLMWTYQQALPTAAPGQKWVPMKKIFELKKDV